MKYNIIKRIISYILTRKLVKRLREWWNGD